MSKPDLSSIPLPSLAELGKMPRKTAKEMLQEALKGTQKDKTESRQKNPSSSNIQLGQSKTKENSEAAVKSSQSIVDELFKDFIAQKFNRAPGGQEVLETEKIPSSVAESSVDEMSKILDLEISSIQNSSGLKELEEKLSSHVRDRDVKTKSTKHQHRVKSGKRPKHKDAASRSSSETEAKRHNHILLKSISRVEKSDSELEKHDGLLSCRKKNETVLEKTLDKKDEIQQVPEKTEPPSDLNVVSPAAVPEPRAESLSVRIPEVELPSSASATQPEASCSSDSSERVTSGSFDDKERNNFGLMLPNPLARKQAIPKQLGLKLTCSSLSLIKSSDRIDQDGRVWEEGEVNSSNSDNGEAESESEPDGLPSETGSINSDAEDWRSHVHKGKKKHKHKHKKKKKKSSSKNKEKRSKDQQSDEKHSSHDRKHTREKRSTSDRKSRERSRSKSREDSKRRKSRSRSREDTKRRKSRERSRSKSREDSKRRKSRSRSREDTKRRKSRERSRSKSREDIKRRKSRSRSREDTKRRKSRERSRSKSREDNKRRRKEDQADELQKTEASHHKHSSRSRSQSPKHQRSSRKSRSRSRSPLRGRYDEWDARHYSSKKRSRSKSRDRSSDRSKRKSSSSSRREDRRTKESREQRLQIDKAQLRRIAIANALVNMKAGQGPQVEVPVVKSEGKSVQELTEFCKKISDKGKDEDSDLSDTSDEEAPNVEEEEETLIHHPFKIKEPTTTGIVMNIRNCKPLPVLTPLEKQAQKANLRLAFPVSSGSHHRASESEWVPVQRPGPVATAKSAAPQKGKLWSPAEPVVQNIDIGTIISERLQAVRKLQQNPYDVQALSTMHKAQEQASKWATSKHLPGQFTGSTGAKVLSQAELIGDKKHQAWVKKTQLSQAAPVTGGIGMFLLQKMGWKHGQGLGKNSEGSKEPLLLDIKVDRKGQASMTQDKSPYCRDDVRSSLVSVSGLSADKHPVSALMELCNRRKWGPPVFTVVDESGPDHKKNFLFKVRDMSRE
ncbi:hypothetical protein EGW08_011102, partial [Elysia chlorotica]